MILNKTQPVMTPENLFIYDSSKKPHQGHSNPFSEPSAHTFMVHFDISPTDASMQALLKPVGFCFF